MHQKLRKLQQIYIAELRAAKKIADNWWQALLAVEIADSIEAAEAELRRRWPDGVASHPRVIAVMIKCMHACDAANRTLDQDDRESLGSFLMNSIDTVESKDLIDFTDSLTYWPIGEDAAGHPI